MSKICTKCKIEKELSEFYFRKDSNSYRNECKECLITINQNFKYNIVPWRKHFYSARRRCNNLLDKRYKDYGDRGIKFLLIIEEVKQLWIRDRAELLKQPSIDRKDNDGNYDYNNCRFIEMIQNSNENKRERKGKPIRQIDFNGYTINTFISIRQASKITGIPNSNINNVVNGIRKTAGGFCWRYQNV